MRTFPELIAEVCRVSGPAPPEATGNHPYLEAMLKDGLFGDRRTVEDLWLPLVPAERADDQDRRLETARRHANRGHLRRTYSWAIPNDAALDAIAELGPVVELGAGGGYWTRLLRERGVEVAAFDRNPPPPEGRKRGWSWRRWAEVKPGGLGVLESHPDHTLLLCWPSPGNTRTCWAAEALRLAPQRRLVYVGEELGGCVGSDLFHHRLRDQFRLIRETVIPRWSLTNDLLQVLERPADRLPTVAKAGSQVKTATAPGIS